MKIPIPTTGLYLVMKRVLTTALGCLYASIIVANDTSHAQPVFEIEGSYEDAVIDRGHLILSAREAEMGDSDVQVYKLSKGRVSGKVGRYFSTGHAHSIALKGQYLVIANGEMGIDIVDLSDFKKPVEVASIDLDGYSQQVEVKGDLVYVASGFHGMHIVDISNPHKPHLISTFQAYPPPEKSMLTEDEADGLFSNSGEQESAGTFNAGSNQDFYDADDMPTYEETEEEVSLKDIERDDGVMGLQLSGNVVFVAYGSAGVVSVDISNPAHPEKLQELRFEFPVEQLLLDGEILHAVTGVGGVQLIDVSQPEKMKLQGLYRTYCYPQDLAQSGEYIYIADGYCGGDGLITVSVDGKYDTKMMPLSSGGVGRVAATGGFIFSMGQNKVQAFKPQ